MASINLLSTKPLKTANESRLIAHGIVLHTHSFIRIVLEEQLNFPKVKQADAIFTSVNALKAIMPFLDQLPAFNHTYCIAGETERLAKKLFGSAPNYITCSYASILAQKIIEVSQNESPLWFFKGNKALPTIPDALQQANVLFESFEVYRNVCNPKKMEQHFDAILFFSPSAVESYCMDNVIPNNTITFAIGTTTAAALEGKAKHIQIADQPNEMAVVAAVIRFFNSIEQ